MALEESQYVYSNMGADYSVTDLIKPVKVTLLTQRHRHELPPEEDDTVLIQSIIGSGTHRNLEWLTKRYAMKHPEINLRTELRVWDKFLDRKITGQFDGWLDGLLYDYKITKSWKIIFGDYKDWTRQLNLYCYMARLVGYETHTMAVNAVLKDWQQGKIYTKDYPRLNYIGVKIPIWTMQEQHDYLISRVQLCKENEEMLDEELPDCTPEEMWETPEKYAIIEPNKSKATRLVSSEKEVESYLKWRKDKGKEIKKYKVEHRPAVRKRCDNYCNVSGWCRQYQEYCELQKK